MVTIEFNAKNDELTIKSSERITDFSQLMDVLGDHDIVQANEIKQNYIAMDGYVYELDDISINELSSVGEVTLPFIGTVNQLGDRDFIDWYWGKISIFTTVNKIT